MKIKKLPLGTLQANCYLLIKENKVLIIDPGAELNLIEAAIGNLQVVGCLITHYHFDHIGALKEIEEKYHIQANNYSAINNFSFEIIKTPGHTSDSLTYYFPQEKMMFTGDFLFAGTIGRTDLPTGNILEMQKSLNLIKNYPEDTIVYPGHGPSTILGTEKELFPYYF